MFAFAHTVFAPSMALALFIIGFQLAYKKAVKEAGKQLAGIAQSTYEDADGLLYYADSNRQFPVPIINAKL